MVRVLICNHNSSSLTLKVELQWVLCENHDSKQTKQNKNIFDSLYLTLTLYFCFIKPGSVIFHRDTVL